MKRPGKPRHGVRIVLAFYTSGEDASAVFPELRKCGLKEMALLGPTGLLAGSKRLRNRYAALRAGDETLVLAEAPPQLTRCALTLLQQAGSPAVFVIPSSFPSQRGRVNDTRIPIAKRLTESEVILESVRRDLADASRLDHAPTAAAEWILDNSYLFRAHIAEVRRDLPRAYAKNLPMGGTDLRIYEVAKEMAARTDFAMDAARIVAYLKEWQKQASLTIAELWFFPLMLRTALVEGLAELALRVNQAQQLRELAYLWANRFAVNMRQDAESFTRISRILEQEAYAGEPDFATSLAEQLQGEDAALVPLRQWIEQRFGVPVGELVQREHAREAAVRLSTVNAFGSFRALNSIDFGAIFEAVSIVETILRTDPSGVYAQSDFTTRDRCRRVVERLARHSEFDEAEVARQAVALASRSTAPREGCVPYYLVAEGMPELESSLAVRVFFLTRLHRSIQHHSTPLYLGSVTILTVCLLALALSLAHESGVTRFSSLFLLGGMALFPLSELAIQILNAFVVSVFLPSTLAKMDFRQGIPDDDATLVVVPMMLTSVEGCRREIEKLEVRFLANREANLFFSLFGDYTDHSEPEHPEDADLLEVLRSGIDDLNGRYPKSQFALFHRPRDWSASEQRWIGRERKRGKLEDLNAYLLGEHPANICVTGILPAKVRYVITLDSDTQLPPGTARRMVETIAHPLNRVEIDVEARKRLRGYSLIQPRVTVYLPGATTTRFTRIFADPTGIDPYHRSVSDAQQDLFREATFYGKGIYDVEAFHTLLADRFPRETILSHDLIEGAHAGVGLASDIELFENVPLDYSSYSKREHRWIRGDWQIAAWVLPNAPGGSGEPVINPLSAINRWRIFDNLRRSLVPPASTCLLLYSWVTLSAPGVWSSVVALGVVIPALAPLADRLAYRIRGSVRRWRGAERELVRALVNLVFLPYQAWLSADAIVRALYRRHLSRRNLLEWEISEASGAARGQGPAATFQRTLIISGGALALSFLGLVQGRVGLMPLLIGSWSLEPLFLRWLEQTGTRPRSKTLDREDSRYLRRIARRTWRYFDDLVCAESNWLPPDNSQLALRVEVAQRTSPTNIGFWLTSALAATDLGYLTTADFLDRCERTLDTMERMERYEGHLLNWYDIRSLDPLPPRYISSVDSGNLIASLWVFAQGCREMVSKPVLGHRSLHGLTDTVAVTREACGHDPSVTESLDALRRILGGRITSSLNHRLGLTVPPLQRLKDSARLREEGQEASYWLSRLIRDLESWNEVNRGYLRWLELLAQPPDSALRNLGADAVRLRRKALQLTPSLQDLVGDDMVPVKTLLDADTFRSATADQRQWLEQLKDAREEARTLAAQAISRLENLERRCRQFADGINMRFLYDPVRRLFGIGYATGNPVQFNGHYDLLTSESRLSSLVAIAKGDAPVDHWFSMARPRVTLKGGRQVLLSWSGTMFEYLMPLLFMRSYENSLLDYGCRQALREQIQYGETNGVPWGISECAYSALDANRIYQYYAFGVPSLAFNQASENALVVSSYSTMLALSMDPTAAIENLRELQRRGMAGPMGFYESLDFSREAHEDGTAGVVIYTHMAHHEGMSLLALDNILHAGVMQQRFHADVRVRAVESLLFEQIPITKPPTEESEKRSPRRLEVPDEFAGRTWVGETLKPRIQLCGNGRYSLMLTNAGGGYSRWNEFDITRWRSGAVGNAMGSFVYVRDNSSGKVWSATQEPVRQANAENFVYFSADHAEFRKVSDDIDTVMKVAVAPDEDLELRQLTVTNRSLRRRNIELTSYMELALATHGSDVSHPAFAKMFVQTERWDRHVLAATRRPRSPEDSPVWAAHVLLGATGKISCETDRGKFLGRGRTARNPEALSGTLTDSIGTVLDPIFSFRCSVTLEPRQRKTFTFLTLAASSREALAGIIAKYDQPGSASQMFELAWIRSQLQFRYLTLGPSGAHRFQELARHLIFPSAGLRVSSAQLVASQAGRLGLWKHGISGDLPIMSVTVSETSQLRLLREVLVAHTYWRLLGLRSDLVVLSQEGPSYDRPLYNAATRLIAAHSELTGTNQPGGVFLRDESFILPEDLSAILAASSVVLRGARGSLQNQLVERGEPIEPADLAISKVQEEPSAPLPFLELAYFNGTGGFSAEGREYAIYLKPRANTPAPWVNVLANARFGTVLSESGLGFTWNQSSQSNRLTPWHNDPVSDPQSEAIYIRDEETGAVWTPTPLPIRENDAYRARHGQGYSVFEHNSHAVEQVLTVFVPLGGERPDPVKICRLRLRNASSRVRRLTVTYFAEWVLGTNREEQQLHVRTAYDESSGALTASQHWMGTCAGHVAFAAMLPRASSYSGDRIQFLGRHGSPEKPAALVRKHLGNRSGGGWDPGAAIQAAVVIEPGREVEVTILLGQDETLAAVRALIARYDTPEKVNAARELTRDRWDGLLSTIQVSTPVKSVDFLLNRWLPYQTLACRFWARSGFYQSSGAYGFRDQLQDAMALVYFAPELTRQHILTAAARQFLQGDVQHWWHPDTGAGVRTRCSDDLVWLPYTVAHYVAVTGDASVLDENVSFLGGDELTPEEQERMFTPVPSEQSEPVWEHCIRALDRAWRLGEHGLPLFGSGDWNDGMNRVGSQGRGESVWLAFFLCETLRLFAAMMQLHPRGPDRTEVWHQRIRDLESAISRHCWDGNWYLRGFFDNGAPLGSHTASESKIDSLPQSWAVISGVGDPDLARRGMESVSEHLVDEKNRLVRLLTPPFDHSEPHPGYIMGYPPGIRENGGQYTHGSLWAALAWARLGNGTEAARLLMLMNPIEHSRDPGAAERYRVEPYVAPADVYSAASRPGQGGWTWYTGSAAWMYRIWIEDVLGFRLRGSLLRITPTIPADWDGFQITYRYKSATYVIDVKRASGNQPAAEFDGVALPEPAFELTDDGQTHTLIVRLKGETADALALPQTETSTARRGTSPLVATN